MMNKSLLTFVVSMIFLFAILPSVSAEMWYWGTTNIDYTAQTTSQHGYYQFDDTSLNGIGKNKPIEVILWYDVEGLPYNLNAGNVDWCNFSIIHQVNNYGSNYVAWEGLVSGEYLGTNTTEDNVYFTATGNHSSGQLSYLLKDKDGLVIDMKCHYTDINSIFQNSVLVGRYTTIFGAYECNKCEDYSLEELSDSIGRSDELIAQQTEIYDKIQYLIGLNFQLWLFVDWVVKIAFLITAFGLVCAGIYYLYLFFKQIEEQI